MDDNFYDKFYYKKQKKAKNKSQSRNHYREKVLEYLQLEFCEIGDLAVWLVFPTWQVCKEVADANLDPDELRVTVMSIINDCFLDGIKINNAAGTVYEWLKGRNLI
jgi:hypothetical protein